MPPIRRTNLSRRTNRANRMLNRRRIALDQERRDSTLSELETLQNASPQSSRRPLNLNFGAFQYVSSEEYQNHRDAVIGQMDQVCRFCDARKFLGEPVGLCCLNGKIRLPSLSPPPEPLQTLMSGNTSDSRHFLKEIRRYNASFQMTSFGATSVVDNLGYLPTFKIQGQVYHKTGSLLPLANQTARFLQIYFIGDESAEVDQRCQTILETRRNIVLDLQRFLHANNR